MNDRARPDFSIDSVLPFIDRLPESARASMLALVEEIKLLVDVYEAQIKKKDNEIERLRTIEDALLATEKLPPGRAKALAYVTLAETLRRNPRPEGSDEKTD